MKFSIYSLRPYSEAESKAFFQFRCKDVAAMFTLWIVLLVGHALIRTAIMLWTKETLNVQKLMFTYLSTLIYLAVWTFRRKKAFIYFLPALFIMSLVQMMYNTRAELSIEEESSTTHVMTSGVFKLAVLMFIFGTLLSPSHIFVLVAYSPVFIIAVIIQIKVLGDVDN